MTLSLLIEIGGWGLLLLALIHGIFPKYFHWKEELKPLSLVNRQMMSIHTFFIALTVGLNGLLCITSAELLINTELGKRISCGLAIFWACRLYCQLFWYSSKLWKGKIFETSVHIIFSLTWICLTTLYAYTAFKKL